MKNKFIIAALALAVLVLWSFTLKQEGTTNDTSVIHSPTVNHTDPVGGLIIEDEILQ